jgi:replicative DNA helicase
LVDYAEKFTDLTKQGDVYRGICPVCKHDNNTEFAVYNHKTYHCWACGSGGDVINLIRDKDGVDFYTAVEKLADELNVDITRDKTYSKRKEAVTFREQKAKEAHKRVGVVKDYLQKERGLSSDSIDYFALGADGYGNVTIPFIDANGRYVGWAIRRFEGSPKYLTNKNDDIFTKSEFLYNFRGAKKLLENQLYLVEGFFCAMSLHQIGKAAVAYNSSQPSKQHIQQIAELQKVYEELTVTIVPDNDGVAYPLIEKVRKNVLRYAPNLPVEILMLPDGIKDVNEYFAKGNTAEAFESLPKISMDLFVLIGKLDKCVSPVAERKVVEAYAPSVRDNITLFHIADYLSERWKTEKKAVQDFLKVSMDGVCLVEDLKDPETCMAETIQMLKEPAMQYGVPVLDKGIRGAGRRKDVTIVGGQSGTGKTFFTVGMAADMVVRQRKNVLFFSMEMSAGALYERVLGYLLQKSSDTVDAMLLARDELVLNVLEKLKDHLYVVDKNGLSMSEIDKYVKEANAKKFDGNLDCIFIDYIQYMKGMSTYETFAETVKGLKPLAKDNNIHVVALSQLNRESKPWDKPDMGKLKGGGDLEASADEILLMWRPGLDPMLVPEEMAMKKNVVMLSVGKARHGSQIEEIEMVLDKSISRIKMP